MRKKAVLYIVFNRPDLVKKSLSAIREARPDRLYISADGPRTNRPDDNKLCADVRDVIEQEVNWDCTVYKRYQDENLGCGLAVSSALDWFFSNEEEGVILEDDCLPHLSFFKFCDVLLEKYRDDKHIFQISGSNWQKGKKRGKGDYYFSHLSSVWGWATWRDRWNMYHYDISSQDELWRRVSNNLDVITCSSEEKEYHLKCFERTAKGEIDTWDYQWRFLMISKKGLNIVPNFNLVSNVGHRADGTHTTNEDHWRADLPIQSIDFPLRHPLKIKANKKADKFLADSIWVPSKEKTKVSLLNNLFRKAFGRIIK